MLNKVYSEVHVLGFKQPVNTVKRPVLIRIKPQTRSVVCSHQTFIYVLAL